MANSVSNVSAATSSTTLLAANSRRRRAVIFNDSAVTLYVKWGSSASSTSFTEKLYSGESHYIAGEEYKGILTGIWDAATGAARVTETDDG